MKGVWLEEGEAAELSISGARGRGGAKGRVGTRTLARGSPALLTVSVAVVPVAAVSLCRTA